MSNIQCNKVRIRQLKKTYKGLSVNQKRYIKALERFEQMDKALSDFYLHAPRSADGQVNWTALSEVDLDCFDFYNDEKSKAMRTISRLEDIIDVNMTLSIFKQINLRSESF